MQQVGESSANFTARTGVTDEAAKAAKSRKLAEKRAVREAQEAERLRRPSRKSRRIEGKAVEVETPLVFERKQRESSQTRTRPPTISKRRELGDEGRAFLRDIVGDVEEREMTAPDALDQVEYSLSADDVVAPTQEKINSLAFLPRADRIVVACGDNAGYVALWSPSDEGSGVKQENPAARMVTYQPHLRPMSQLLFAEPTKLLSASRDGSVRVFDLNAATYSTVYQSSSKSPLRSLAASSTRQCYYAGCDDGGLRVIDVRARPQTEKLRLHTAAINSVHQHPSLDQCIVTASADSTVSIWDARKLTYLSTPLLQLHGHSNSVSCAYFSPHDGAWLVTVGLQSRHNYSCFSTPARSFTINVHDTSAFTSDTTTITWDASIRIHHRTRRKLQAAWDPKRPNLFAIGSLAQPLRTQIFRSDSAQPVREFVSDNFDNVTSVHAFHPHLELIAGCADDASGKLALWRGKKATADDEPKVKAEKREVA
ncbi:WD repeat-containing protein 76 [Phytophthora pseudosyringae]|uniref:WD repeat-containing protein 76 n=1 Tax=Phytophthora pseudosyringae TaxID=221518 RepID=A0A8T1WE25_9STRA|nr:WD repeat-containing protein 76 [Phytophthora pseudosyringae]